VSSSVGIVIFIVALLVTILIHEAAHFGVAKAFGIKVEEFFVGFGPRLWSFRRGETEYGVKALPLGGYVRIAGMNPYEEIPPEELSRTFPAKPAWQRALVIFAGPATHFVMAFVFFALWLGLVGQPVAHGVAVGAVERRLNGHTSPAAEAGLKPGDRIVGVDGIRRPSPDQLVEYTRAHVGEPVLLTIQRDGERFTVRITPELSTLEGERVGRIGVVLSPAVVSSDREGVAGSVTGGVRLVGSTTVEFGKNLGRLFDVGRVFHELFGGAPRQPDDPASLVGVARIAGQTAERNVGDLLQILGALNIVIGLLNLLPLPPFDGGHLAIIGLEKILRRKIDVRRMVPVTAAVAAFLLVFVGSLVLLDIIKPIPLP
jgi:membrane-associated protease RseP (regulator of RpoE activity)